MVARTPTATARRAVNASRYLGVIVMSIGIGGAAYMSGKGSVPEVRSEQSRIYVPEFNVVEVPVPDRPVGAGVAMRQVPIRLEKFPEHQLPRGVVRDVGRVRDAVTLVALPGGLPILEVNLGSADEASNPLVGRIPPGMRAMTVRVDATSAVEGWARSGSVIDVLLVEKNKTSVVAENVKIISTERSLSAAVSLDSEAPIPSTVTLLVTQEQCLAINTAVAVGKIAFALRGGADGERWRDGDFDAEDLNGASGRKAGAKVEGVVSVGRGRDKRNYALVDGRWIPAESVPSGFFVHQESSGGGSD
jgi:pilus assembly protein CpaB